MLKILFLLFLVIIVVYCIRNKIRIKFKTFLRRGFSPDRGKFGVYCYDGKQGSGKTYSVVEFLLKHPDMKIYANLKSLKGVDYTAISGIDGLLALRKEHDCIIFFDEIFTILSKKNSSRLSKKDIDAVLDFLSQMRKRHIIFITTAQEWLEIDMTLRRYCRYRISCKMYNFFGLGILVKHFADAENMKWSNDENDYVAPLIETTVSKCNLYIANSYDTYEQIHSEG